MIPLLSFSQKGTDSVLISTIHAKKIIKELKEFDLLKKEHDVIIVQANNYMNLYKTEKEKYNLSESNNKQLEALNKLNNSRNIELNNLILLNEKKYNKELNKIKLKKNIAYIGGIGIGLSAGIILGLIIF